MYCRNCRSTLTAVTNGYFCNKCGTTQEINYSAPIQYGTNIVISKEEYDYLRALESKYKDIFDILKILLK